MKKIFFTLFFAIVITQTNYSQSPHKQKHKKAKACCEAALTDTCQRTGSHTIFQSSNEVNKRLEFSTTPLFICPIGDDVYIKVLNRAFRGIQITY